MARFVFVFFFILLLANSTLALAEETVVGFPGQSVWLSRSSAVAGETIQLYAALYNAGVKKFSGTIVFLVDNERVAEKEFSLEPGASTLESALWASTEGAHTVRASIENASGPALASITETSGVVAFAVSKPAAQPIAESVSKVTGAISTTAASVIPHVQAAIQTVHTAIEPYRESTVTYLENVQKKHEEQSTQKEKRTREMVEKDSGNLATNSKPAERNAYTETAKGAWSILSQVALVGALYAAKTPAIFYALLLAVIVGTLYGFFRWALRRPF